MLPDEALSIVNLYSADQGPPAHHNAPHGDKVARGHDEFDAQLNAQFDAQLDTQAKAPQHPRGHNKQRPNIVYRRDTKVVDGDPLSSSILSPRTNRLTRFTCFLARWGRLDQKVQGPVPGNEHHWLGRQGP